MDSRLRVAALVLLVACRSAPSSSDAGPDDQPDSKGPHDLDGDLHDLALYDFAVDDLAQGSLDFAVSDLAGGPHDLAHPIYDLAHPIYDLAHPIYDLAHPADFAAELQACETCLSGPCPSQEQACEDDPHCTATLSCAVGRGCFTYSSGSQTFASCVEQCASQSGLTLGQEAQVLGEIAALSTCGGSCVAACGGN